jgi:nicotinamide-nucleotide amidase
MLRIECIAIGSELLNTPRLDTNSVWLAARLGELGLAFHRKTAVGDSRDDLRELFREALDRSDLILCTGGLGPTFDDFTKEVWAEVLDAPLVEDPASRQAILDFYASRNRVPVASNFKQSLIPLGAHALHNPAGTAPGVLWENPPGHPGRTVILFPGVPREMKLMWANHVAGRLEGFKGAPTTTLRMVFGSVPESTLDERARPLRDQYAQLDWTILAGLHHVEILARGPDPQVLAAVERDFRTYLGRDLAFVGPEGGIEDGLLTLLEARGETLALAESMTGGNMAARLTSVPGSSRVFQGGGVVYSVAAKAALAGLDPDFIRAAGTVSEPVARALAEGIRARLGTTWGLAVTGNAGPTEDKDGQAAVGTCLVAAAGPEGTFYKAFTLFGSRVEMQARGASWALDHLRRTILEKTS